MTITPNMTAEEIARKFVTLAGKDKDNVAFNGRHFKHINDPDTAEIACGRYREHITELAAAIIDAHKPKWIPVAERLPDHCGSVLGRWGGEGEPEYYETRFNGEEWMTFEHYGWTGANPPTEWQPLPEPPAEKP